MVNYFIFIYLSVKLKFSLEPETILSLQDDQGADIDEEVLPYYLDQTVIPNITFIVEGEVISELSPEGSVAGAPQIIYGK